MAEPAVKKGKTRAQLDAQLGRINTAIERAYDEAENWDERRRMQRRWFNATSAYGRLSGDDKLIRSFADYRPETRGFTTFKEMDKINDHFGLENRSVESLRALRNNIVDAWSNRDRNGRQAWDRDDMTEWMQSLTATIDYYIRKKGGEV